MVIVWRCLLGPPMVFCLLKLWNEYVMYVKVSIHKQIYLPCCIGQAPALTWRSKLALFMLLVFASKTRLSSVFLSLSFLFQTWRFWLFFSMHCTTEFQKTGVLVVFLYSFFLILHFFFPKRLSYYFVGHCVYMFKVWCVLCPACCVCICVWGVCKCLIHHTFDRVLDPQPPATNLMGKSTELGGTQSLAKAVT